MKGEFFLASKLIMPDWNSHGSTLGASAFDKAKLVFCDGIGLRQRFGLGLRSKAVVVVRISRRIVVIIEHIIVHFASFDMFGKVTQRIPMILRTD